MRAQRVWALLAACLFVWVGSYVVLRVYAQLRPERTIMLPWTAFEGHAIEASEGLKPKLEAFYRPLQRLDYALTGDGLLIVDHTEIVR